MAFRSNLEAAHARAQALEGKVAALEAENAELRGASEPESEFEPKAESHDTALEVRKVRASIIKAVLVLALVGMGVVFVFYRSAVVPAALVVGFLTVFVVVGLEVARSLVHTCPPGYVIVLSGRSHPGPDGCTLGYRVVSSGRVVRIPVLEVAELLDCQRRTIECEVAGAYAKDSIVQHVVVSASYRLSMHQPAVNNAVERFLGRDTSEVDRVAGETIEGHLRGVISTLTMAELQQDHVRVAQAVLQEVEDDLAKLGMEIDTLAITAIAGPEHPGH